MILALVQGGTLSRSSDGQIGVSTGLLDLSLFIKGPYVTAMMGCLINKDGGPRRREFVRFCMGFRFGGRTSATRWTNRC